MDAREIFDGYFPNIDIGLCRLHLLGLLGKEDRHFIKLLFSDPDVQRFWILPDYLAGDAEAIHKFLLQEYMKCVGFTYVIQTQERENAGIISVEFRNRGYATAALTMLGFF